MSTIHATASALSVENVHDDVHSLPNLDGYDSIICGSYPVPSEESACEWREWSEALLAMNSLDACPMTFDIDYGDMPCSGSYTLQCRPRLETDDNVGLHYVALARHDDTGAFKLFVWFDAETMPNDRYYWNTPFDLYPATDSDILTYQNCA